ncbi:cation diffusion facilitator family transporter, partial [Basilea psittacipulmonis]
MQHNHHEHHHHSHHHNSDAKHLLIAFFIILGFMVVEFLGGMIAGSLALLADAGHMLTDALALGIAYFAIKIANQPANSSHSFGYMRIEVISALLNALTLIGIVIWIIYEAILRFYAPKDIMTHTMMIIAVTGMMVNIFVLWFLHKRDTDQINIKGAILHVIGDLLGSVAAVIAAIVIQFTGWTYIDPILSIFVALLILKSAYSLLKSTLHILLEASPQDLNIDEVKAQLLEKIDNLQHISHIHIWSITSGKNIAVIHVKPKAYEHLPELCHQIEAYLEHEFHIVHTSVAIDW